MSAMEIDDEQQQQQPPSATKQQQGDGDGTSTSSSSSTTSTGMSTRRRPSPPKQGGQGAAAPAEGEVNEGGKSGPGPPAAAAAAAAAALPQTISPPPPELVDPEPLPPPRMNDCVKRTLEVISQGRLHAVECLVSLAGTQAVYALIRTLRPAIYGKVKLGMTLQTRAEDGSYHMSTEHPVAIKIVRKEKLGGRSQEDPLKEISVMQYLASSSSSSLPSTSSSSGAGGGGGGGHPNVMGLVEVLQDAENIYIILPFCDGGEVCQWFERSRYMLREEVARGFFLQIVSGLAYLHSRGVVHRDMSLENLLYDQKTKRCIIIDLGMCLHLPVPATSDILVRKQGYCGKLTYMSHEIYKNKDFNAAAVDIWAMGVILFIMLTGIPPVETPAEIDPRFRMLAEGRLFELMDLWRVDFLSAEARDLLFGLLQVDPRQRLTMKEIQKHPWVGGPVSAALTGEGEGEGEEKKEEGFGAVAEASV